MATFVVIDDIVKENYLTIKENLSGFNVCQLINLLRNAFSADTA